MPVVRRPISQLGRLLGALGVLAAAYNDQPARFLLMSSPTTGHVYYAPVPTAETLTPPLRKRRDAPEAVVLIDGELSRCKGSACTDSSDEGLKSPTGLALYQGPTHSTLYVSDTGSENIYAYELASKAGNFDWSGDGLKVGRQRRVRQGVQGAQGLALDGEGNLFYTTTSGQVEMIEASQLESGGDATPTLLYDGSRFDAISTPVDIATDGYHLYWTNMAGGPQSGSLAEALKSPLKDDVNTVGQKIQRVGDPRPLAANGIGAWGVCYARGNVYYTAETKSLYAVANSGGSIAEVSHGLVAPRGCTFDGESTLYVADSGDNAIYSLVASPTLRAVRHLHRAVSVNSPSQVVVFESRGRKLQGEVLEYWSGALQRSHPSMAATVVLTVLMLAWRT